MNNRETKKEKETLHAAHRNIQVGGDDHIRHGHLTGRAPAATQHQKAWKKLPPLPRQGAKTREKIQTGREVAQCGVSSYKAPAGPPPTHSYGRR